MGLVCCMSHNLSLLQIRDEGVDLTISPNIRPKCANREMTFRISCFRRLLILVLGVALLGQEIGSCPSRAHTRVSIPRSIELGDSSLARRVAAPGRRASELRN